MATPTLTSLPTSQSSSEIDKAFLIILSQLDKKDARIRSLERQIKELTLQLEHQSHQTQFPIESQINYNSNYRECQTLDNLIIPNQSTFLRNQLDSSNRLNYNSDSEQRLKTYYCNTNPNVNVNAKANVNANNNNQTPSNSFISGIDRGQSKNDVKAFLSEVKSQVDSKTFKEFIKCIKLLTNKTIAVNKKEVFDTVQSLLGLKHKALYKKFEEILGYGR